eukprot:g16749.t1
MVAITKEKVLEKLNGLKVNKEPGPNGLHSRLLKEIAEEIVEALVVILQEITREVRQKTENYLSLTSFKDKILESIVKDEISEYLEVHEFFEEVMSRFDQGEPMDVIYLDFKKAFDKVSHRRL